MISLSVQDSTAWVSTQLYADMKGKKSSLSGICKCRSMMYISLIGFFNSIVYGCF